MDVSDPAYPARGDEPPRLGAVVLAGGTAVRMDGIDKASIELDGVTLLERALAATMTAVEVVVVGDQVPTSRPVTWTFEYPRGGGPAAGVLAALDRFLRPPDLVAVLAVDMPRVSPGTFARLASAVAPGVDGAVLLDGEGRRQWLCGVYRRASLDAARPADQEAEHGLPAHRLLDGLVLVEVPAVDHEADDVDTWLDLRALRQDREERDRRTP
jgi:molybdopterin-guanine dinucleotide biosynthesis protein A